MVNSILMNIFGIYLSQNCIKIYFKTHQIAPFKINFSGEHAPEPLYGTRGKSRFAVRNSPKHKKSSAPPPWQILHKPMIKPIEWPQNANKFAFGFFKSIRQYKS